jgi:AraC family transcriptional activator of mtrCDE
MKWSLSEFLNLIELRSQTWCFVDLAQPGGFSIPAGEVLYLYAVVEGQARLAGVAGGPLELKAGEMVIVVSGDAHAVRGQGLEATSPFEFLAGGDYVDAPAHFAFGAGRPAARLLCSRLKVRWPGGGAPKSLPALLRCSEPLVDIRALVQAASGAGASAVLTRFAHLLFVEAFRKHPDCQAVFRDSNLNNPIARAVQYLEIHPFQHWTVEILARKVGMSRANFAARFVAETGRTPFDVLTAARMRLAADFIRDTGLKVSEISERVGYRSESAFSRRFTDHFGMSPGSMRAQVHAMPVRRKAG